MDNDGNYYASLQQPHLPSSLAPRTRQAGDDEALLGQLIHKLVEARVHLAYEMKEERKK